jgi:hypothetical protein
MGIDEKERERAILDVTAQLLLRALPLSVVDNSAFSPNCLTISLDPAYPSL